MSTIGNKAAAKTAVTTTCTTTQLQNVCAAAVDAYLALIETVGRGKHPHLDALIDAIRTNIGHITG